MDWGRAKSVLIFSFLLLNVLLGYQLWSDIREQLNTNVDLTVLPPETLRIMQMKDIRLTEGIPSDTPMLGDLAFRYLHKASENDNIQLEIPVDSRIVYTESELELVEGLGDAIPDLPLYRFDSKIVTDEQTGDEDRFVLFRLHDGLPMFDVKLELLYSDQKIIAYRQDRIEIVPSGGSEAQAVLPASKWMTHLVENYLQAGSVIQEIRLGYHGQTFNSDDVQIAEPSWRVLLEDGVIYYVNAISGEVVTENDDAPEGAAS